MKENKNFNKILSLMLVCMSGIGNFPQSVKADNSEYHAKSSLIKEESKKSDPKKECLKSKNKNLKPLYFSLLAAPLAITWLICKNKKGKSGESPKSLDPKIDPKIDPKNKPVQNNQNESKIDFNSIDKKSNQINKIMFRMPPGKDIKGIKWFDNTSGKDFKPLKSLPEFTLSLSEFFIKLNAVVKRVSGHFGENSEEIKCLTQWPYFAREFNKNFSMEQSTDPCTSGQRKTIDDVMAFQTPVEQSFEVYRGMG
jgi:hypothetical protein